jgi:protein-S-isoprenylcysteine O-methyltransferase Ste14
MAINNKIDKKGPAVKFPPPLVFLSLLLVGYGLHQIAPISLGMPLWGKILGSALIIAGMCSLFVLLMTYLRNKTSIEPWKPTTHIITSGLYAWSRNPIYASFCLLTIGVGLFLNSLWIVLSFLPASVLVYYLAIKKEEAYLEAKFGAQYLRYKDKVRRWL